jgi:DNA primase
MCEGPFDWLAARAWGLAACCLCGTHTPPERLPALEAAVAVYGVLDPDKAGLSAAERLAPIIGDRWRPVHLPDGQDLADLAARGPASRGQFDVLVRRARAAAWLGEEATPA